jgi:iron complex transport system substrate-binding protein
MKNKTLASLEIAIVFCLLFFVALPGIAAASEDETLDIYGNANEDDIIDMRDLTFTARMILRLEDETELADANYDGRVSVADMTQIGLIILGRESKLTLVDSSDRIVTVNKPVERIVSGHPTTTEGISLLGAWDRVVGIGQYAADEILFPGSSDLPVCLGPMHYDIYYETVFELDPDIFLSFYVLGMPGFEDSHARARRNTCCLSKLRTSSNAGRKHKKTAIRAQYGRKW